LSRPLISATDPLDEGHIFIPAILFAEFIGEVAADDDDGDS
jgi:hypothetical protein